MTALTVTCVRFPEIRTPTLVPGAKGDSQRSRFEAAQRLIASSRGNPFDGTHPMQDLANPGRAHEYAVVVRQFLEEVAG